MNKRFSLVAPLMALALALQFSAGLFQPASAHTPLGQISTAGVASSADGMVEIIVQLDSEPVVARELAASPGRGRVAVESVRGDRGVDFHSATARAYEAQLEGEHANFKSRARQLSSNLRVVTDLTKLINAVSVEVPSADVVGIAAMPGVKRVERVKEYRMATDTSVRLINAPTAWEYLGGPDGAGRGVKIAILDTGIDSSNPLFSDNGFEMPEGFPKFNNDNEKYTNKKVIAAKSFLSSSSEAKDENGHGTNVAGIAGGNLNTQSPIGLICGVAPQAYLGNYRVLGKTGSGSSSLIARAVQEAVSDGFDVINLSLGAEADSVLNSLDETVEAAVAAGKVVVVAAGNAGNGGNGDAQTVGSPGVAPHAITVAAASNGHTVGPVVSVTGPDPVANSLVNITSANGNQVPLDGSLVSSPIAEADAQGRGCSALAANSLSGKVALIERGNCDFAIKVNNAKGAGARAVIVYNKDISEGEDGGETLINMQVAGTTIPSVFIGRSAGLALRDFIRSNQSAAITILPVGSQSAVSDVIASFSSRGPSTPGALKPDLAAPGIAIYSGAVTSVPSGAVDPTVDPSGFIAISGTSQATPHVAGAAALMRQLHRDWTPEQIKSALMNSAVGDVFTTTAKSTKAGVLATGAGRVDLGRASQISALFSPASLSLGINKLKKKAVTLTPDLVITNQSGDQNTFTVSVEQLDPGDGFDVVPLTNTVTLAPGQSFTLSVTVSAAKSAEKRSYTGFLIFVDSSGQTLRVPYWVQYKKKV